jgi:hypothetical protein
VVNNFRTGISILFALCALGLAFWVLVMLTYTGPVPLKDWVVEVGKERVMLRYFSGALICAAISLYAWVSSTYENSQ